MNATQVLEQIAPATAVRLREVNHSRNTRLRMDGNQVTFYPGSGGRAMEVTEEGVASMRQLVTMPRALENNLSRDTFSRVATELLGHRGKYDVLYGEFGIVAFNKPHQYQALNPERVVGTIEREIRSAQFARVLIMPNQSVRFEIMAVQQQAVARGDMVQAGALVQFSHLGVIQPNVSSYVTRLACTNGMVSMDVLREYSAGGNEGDNIWQWFRRSMRDAVEALSGIVNHYREMRNESIAPADRASVIEALIAEARLNDDVAAAVRARALAEPPRNSYDAMNLMSFATTHDLREPVEVVRGQRAVANFASETAHHRICPACHRSR